MSGAVPLAVGLGLTLGAGVLLIAAPALWPPRVVVAALQPSRLRDRLTQAGLPRVSPATVAAVCAAAGAAAGASVHAVLGIGALSVAAALVAGAAPLAAIAHRARLRRATTRAAWPDVVDQLVSAVRSGVPLPDALAALAVTGPEATRSAFAEFAREFRMTAHFGVALDHLKRLLADPVGDRILETLRMAREVGGSELVSVLRGLAAHLRQEAAIRSEVAARQSWVVNAARLGVAAPWLVLLLLATRPEAARAYNSPAGAALVVGGLLVSVVAYRVMVRIGRLPEEPRWFA